MSRCFDLGCAGCEECCDDEDDLGVCPECQGDGRDKWNDYLLPCPACNPDAAGVALAINNSSEIPNGVSNSSSKKSSNCTDGVDVPDGGQR